MRMGKSAAFSVAMISRVFGFTTETVSASRLVIQTSRPSGVMSMPSAPAPVGICFRTFRPVRSIAVTDPEPMLATKARVASGVAETMWETSAPVGMRR